MEVHSGAMNGPSEFAELGPRAMIDQTEHIGRKREARRTRRDTWRDRGRCVSRRPTAAPWRAFSAHTDRALEATKSHGQKPRRERSWRAHPREDWRWRRLETMASSTVVHGVPENFCSTVSALTREGTKAGRRRNERVARMVRH